MNIKRQTESWTLLVLVSVVLSHAARPAAAANVAGSEPLYFYVSVQGDDHWTGRQPAAVPAPAEGSGAIEGPFATLVRARDAIRQLRAETQLVSPVTVMVLDGTYYLDEPLELSWQDSGTAESPLTITAFPG